MFHFLVLFASVSFITGAANASTPFIEVINKKLTNKQLTVLDVTIGTTTLDQVKEKFKSKEIYHEGEAGNSIYALCYKAPNGATIAFETYEGTSGEAIKSISINGPKEPYKFNKICEKTSLIKTKLAINGISLGMSPDLIKHVVGKPSQKTPNSLLYQYIFQEKTEKGQLDTSSSIEVILKNDAVTAITMKSL